MDNATALPGVNASALCHLSVMRFESQQVLKVFALPRSELVAVSTRRFGPGERRDDRLDRMLAQHLSIRAAA